MLLVPVDHDCETQSVHVNGQEELKARVIESPSASVELG